VVEIHDKLKEVLFKRGIKEIMRHINKYLFDIVFINYKFTEQGLMFINNVLDKIFESLKFYDAEIAAECNSKIHEAIDLAKKDKNTVDEILQPMLEIDDSLQDESEKKVKINHLLSKSHLHYLTVSEIQQISKMSILSP